MALFRQRICYVDSDQEACELITALLSRYEVSTARDLHNALSLARRERFDLYLLENWLPDGTGEGLCWEIRSFDRLAPIVLLAAAADAPGHDRALAAGAQALLIKPRDLEQLEATVLCLLGARRAGGT